MIKIITEVEVGHQLLEDVVCTAFEGGINYWCHAVRQGKLPEGRTGESFTSHSRLATTEGGSVELMEFEGESSPFGEHELGLKELKVGLQLMAQNYPRHFAAVMTENYDGETADSLIQLSVFGRIVYG